MKKLFVKFIAIILSATVFPAFFSACSMRGADVVIAGSTSVQPYAQKLARAFEKDYKERNAREIHVDVQGGGSSAGITAARSGVAQLGMSSRDIKSSELTDDPKDSPVKGLRFVERLAKDALAIIVNPDNPVLKALNVSELNLSLAQIQDIYRGVNKRWSDLGGAFSNLGTFDADIHVVTREAGSGTRSAFEELAMRINNHTDYITGEPCPKDGNGNCIIETCKATNYWIKSDATVLSSNGLIRMTVADDKNAVGFISLGMVKENDPTLKPVKAISIDTVKAEPETVKNKSYSLARSFWLVAQEEPTGIVMEFIEFCRGLKGQEIINEELVGVAD